MRRLMMVCFVVCFSMAFVNVMDVQACTGSSSNRLPVDDVLYTAQEYADTSVVVGRINAVSDSQVNAILQIDQVLKGTLSNEFVIYVRDSITNLQFLEEGRGYPYHCGYTGIDLPSGRHFIAALQRGNFGIYWGTVITEDADGHFSIPDSEQPDQTLSVDYEQVVAYALPRLNGTSYHPDNRAMPRAGAVRLITESGNVYLVPADANQPVILEPTPSFTNCHQTCLDEVIASNGVDRAAFYPVGTVNADTNDVYDPFRPQIDGETGVFSQLSDLLAVWVGQELKIYATARQEGLGTGMSGLSLINTLVFHSDDPLLPGDGVWSPDGRTFAFSAQSGIWLWDALSPDAQPRLLVAATNEPIQVRSYSPAGHYLGIESESRLYHIDVATLEEYPDGLFSTDDRLMAVYDTTAIAATPLKIYMLLPTFKPLEIWENSDTKISQFEWTGRRSYFYTTCGDASPDSETPGFDKPWCKIRGQSVGWSNSTWVDGILFDYDPITDSLATVIDPDTITFNGEIIELDGEIDSPIVGVELIPLIDLNHRNF